MHSHLAIIFIIILYLAVSLNTMSWELSFKEEESIRPNQGVPNSAIAGPEPG